VTANCAHLKKATLAISQEKVAKIAADLKVLSAANYEEGFTCISECLDFLEFA
jgi:hypothetical protein